MYDDLLSIKEVAEKFNVTPVTVSLWIKKGLPVTRLGIRKFISVVDVYNFFNPDKKEKKENPAEVFGG